MGLRADRFLTNAERVLGDIRAYAQSPNGEIPASQLAYMVEQIERMKEAALSENLPPKVDRYHVLSRMILDAWPLGTSLGNASLNWKSSTKSYERRAPRRHESSTSGTPANSMARARRRYLSQDPRTGGLSAPSLAAARFCACSKCTTWPTPT